MDTIHYDPTCDDCGGTGRHVQCDEDGGYAVECHCGREWEA